MQALNNKGTKINILGSKRVRGEVLGQAEEKRLTYLLFLLAQLLLFV